MNVNDNQITPAGQSFWRLGVVSYLNAKPLISGLENESAVRLCFDVPSHLPAGLARGEFDAALIPVIDLLYRGCELSIISDACIGSDGETLTVRVFSKVPPDQIRRIHLDLDSHTSAALVRLLWPAVYRQDVEFVDCGESDSIDDFEAVLLIGDKVVAVHPEQFRYQVDLGGAWKTWTGLPFVFAVWAAPKNSASSALGALLSRARDDGVKKAERLAVEYGPAHGWPVSLAQQYLQRYISYGLTDKHVEGMVRFLDLARQHGLSPLREQLQTAL